MVIKLLKDKLRKSPIYYHWIKYQEKKMSNKFNLLLNEINSCDKNYNNGYSIKNLEIRVSELSNNRRNIRIGYEKPTVIAFGNNDDWERFGLWPTMEKLTNFNFFPSSDYKITSKNSKINSHTKKIMTQDFLNYIENVEKSNKINFVFFYDSGPNIDSKIFNILQEKGIWSIVMGLDDKHQFYRNYDHELKIPHQIRVAKQCDLYWTTWKNGSHHILNNGGNAWYAPLAADPKYYYPVSMKKDIEILFIGQSYGYRRLLVNHLINSGFNVTTFGNGWKNGYLDYSEMVNYYSRSKIILGVGDVWSMQGVKGLKGRDFEVPMCGALYLTTYNPELTDHFVIGKEILCYSSFEECTDVLQWILRHEDEANSIRDFALKRSLKCHTWEIRLKEMFNLFPGNLNMDTKTVDLLPRN